MTFETQHMFKWEWEEYITEGVPNEIDPRKADVNRATLDMLLARPIGLFSIIDEETKVKCAIHRVPYFRP